MQKQNENSKKNHFFFLGAIALGLLLYTSLRAAWLSITCDEASTYFSHVPNSVFNCFFSDTCWSDANNHLLNTYLIKFSVGTFGVSELSLRLPNLFGHFLYLIFSLLLVQRFSKNIWIALGGFCLLNFNPYLLEFYSLARGYGLGTGMMMMSIYYLIKWIEDGKIETGMYCYFGAFLAVMSNFVFLNYWASMSAIFVFFLFEKSEWKKMNVLRKSFFQNISIPMLASLVLFFLLKNPIRFLSTKDEFVYGSESLWKSFTEMIRLSLQGQGYFEPFTGNVFILLSIILLLLSLSTGILFFYKKTKNSFSKIHFAASTIMFLILVGMVVQYYLLDIKFLEGRKATMLLPIFGFVGYCFLEFIFREKNKNIAVGLAVIFSVFSFNHFYRTSDFKETVEWRYDAETKNMVKYLNENLPKDRQSKVGVYWFIQPATQFYEEKFSLKNRMKTSRIHDEDFANLNDLDYVYVEKKHGQLIPDNFVLEKEFGEIGLLYRKTTL